MFGSYLNFSDYKDCNFVIFVYGIVVFREVLSILIFNELENLNVEKAKCILAQKPCLYPNSNTDLW